MGRKALITPKQLERMRYMFSEGMPQGEIGKIMGISKSTVGDYLRGARKVTAEAILDEKSNSA